MSERAPDGEEGRARGGARSGDRPSGAPLAAVRVRRRSVAPPKDFRKPIAVRPFQKGGNTLVLSGGFQVNL